MRRLFTVIWHALALVGLVAIIGGLWLAAQGASARPEPGRVETAIARAARHYAIPSSERARTSPATSMPETIRAGMEHWADHCASCHGNDGSGATEMGGGLYPRVPDMRLPATQQLSDGELFHIIEHGVKLTGMPAWGTGTPEGEEASWHLVHFIRHLPALSEDEIAEMEALNPMSEAEWRMREEERRFLSGEEPLKGDMRPGPTDKEHSHTKGQKP